MKNHLTDLLRIVIKLQVVFVVGILNPGTCILLEFHGFPG